MIQRSTTTSKDKKPEEFQKRQKSNESENNLEDIQKQQAYSNIESKR